jgi:hypothetical protein
MKNKQVLLEYLHDMDDFAELKGMECPPIYLLGGSGCILGDYIDRATTDFDLVDMNYKSTAGRLFKMLERFDLLDLYVTPLAPEFEKRAIMLNGFKILKIFILSKEDIIVSKLSRFSEKDIDDIKQLISSSDKGLVSNLIDKVSSRIDFSERVKSIFIKNSKAFKEIFYV